MCLCSFDYLYDSNSFFGCSHSFPQSTRLLEKWERSSELSVSCYTINQHFDSICMEIIRSCLVCRYCCLLSDVYMEGIFYFFISFTLLSSIATHFTAHWNYLLNFWVLTADGMASEGRVDRTRILQGLSNRDVLIHCFSVMIQTISTNQEISMFLFLNSFSLVNFQVLRWIYQTMNQLGSLLYRFWLNL